MARRPVYIPTRDGLTLVLTRMVDFKWHAGMSAAQKRKSVIELHKEAQESLKVDRILEISSKSTSDEGVALSAFNLTFQTKRHERSFTVESVFQGSKVFENGGPYTDIYGAAPRDAKRDERLRTSGKLIAFRFFKDDWPLEPKTAFYDWVYINSLMKNPSLRDTLEYNDAFTDIEFNPDKSINCQAHSAALYVSLKLRNCLDIALSSKESFLEIVNGSCAASAEQACLGLP